MFRRLTALVLILSVLTANFSRLFVYASFELNKDYIVSELCENRDNPLMHCDGQCYLSKKLKQADKKEKDRQQEVQRYHFQEACISERLVWVPSVQHIETIPTLESPFDLPQLSFTIFQPPKKAFII